jgi:hypothetical protein
MSYHPAGATGPSTLSRAGDNLLHGLRRLGHNLAQPRLDLLDRHARLQAICECPACSTQAPRGTPACRAAAVTA